MPSRGRSLRRSLDGLLIVCALTMTVIAVRRVWSSPVRATDGATRFPGWREDLAFGRRIGPANAPYRFVVWTDYQCPACRQFEADIAAARMQLGDSLDVVYRYYPLSGHPLAFPAAVLAECAREQGHFETMHHALFAAQLRGDSLPLDSLMTASAIPDRAALRRCYGDSTSSAHARVQADSHRARTLHLRGTPGVQIGDRVASGALPVDELIARLRAAGK
jgi:protein-disulfide isomerase